MKRALIVSYNLVREGEGETPLSIASILSYLKTNPDYGIKFEVQHLPFNLLDNKKCLNDFESCFRNISLNDYGFIAISCFVWNEYLVNPLIRYLRTNGYKNKIILGGSQITYGNKEQLKIEYPGSDIFISSYAEENLLCILKNEEEKKSYYNSSLNFNHLPSPYLTGEIPLELGHKMLRWETKRGCPFRCSFCAHRNLENGRVHFMHLEKAFRELELFKQKEVKRINVLDPIFNMGSQYIEIMKEIDRLHITNTAFTFQSKLELLTHKRGTEFLNLVEKTNAHLELGLQTIIPEEYEVIERKNSAKIIDEQLEVLNKRNISYEVSLIYGLPNQTPDSFKRSIEFVQNKGCKKITAWPLMLLKGTPLFFESKKWNLKEEEIGDFNIPLVTSSNSFNKDDWFKMREMANCLMANFRV